MSQKIASHPISNMKAQFFVLIYTLGLFTIQADEGSKSPKNYKGPSSHTIDFHKPFIISSDTSDTEWRMWYIAKGTRSEGMHGILQMKKKVIHGSKLYEEKTISGRVFVWYGSWDSRKALFSSSGWLPKDVTEWNTTLQNKSQQTNR